MIGEEEGEVVGEPAEGKDEDDGGEHLDHPLHHGGDDFEDNSIKVMIVVQAMMLVRTSIINRRYVQVNIQALTPGTTNLSCKMTYNQCPTGTQTQPDTRYFFRYPTRPDSVLKIIG